jgi:hypothetical protein
LPAARFGREKRLDRHKRFMRKAHSKPAPSRRIALMWRRGFSRQKDLALLGGFIRARLPRDVVAVSAVLDSG